VCVGAMYAGHIVSPINLLAQDAQLEYTLAHSGTRIIFAAAEQSERLRALLRRMNRGTIVRETDPDDLDLPEVGFARLAAIAPDTAAMLMYNSGENAPSQGALLASRKHMHAA